MWERIAGEDAAAIGVDEVEGRNGQQLQHKVSAIERLEDKAERRKRGTVVGSSESEAVRWWLPAIGLSGARRWGRTERTWN
ncbi:hypothetical protein AMTR_s00112p00122140 [Amborella trichopoda]|uniref:Uncharacterized protein n=1 Tax=Amborella trichopoda TaxID=13333 RepID=W1NWV6_AMBTC|nr:hypothetical protein AMTR_s00112p00122140 [Amborella trichopoda]